MKTIIQEATWECNKISSRRVGIKISQISALKVWIQLIIRLLMDSRAWSLLGSLIKKSNWINYTICKGRFQSRIKFNSLIIKDMIRIVCRAMHLTLQIIWWIKILTIIPPQYSNNHSLQITHTCNGGLSNCSNNRILLVLMKLTSFTN